MRRPVVLWFVLVLALMMAMSHGTAAVRGLVWIGRVPLSISVGTVLTSLLVIGLSIWILMRLQQHTLRSRWPVSVYLWVILLVGPWMNVLRAIGFYLPAPEMKPEELAGAAAFEVFRYLVLLALIVWVALSRALKGYLASIPPRLA